MTLQDIWNQAQKDKHNAFFMGRDSLFTIQNGCKIERFKDGTIVIKNTRLGGDFYKKLTAVEISVFESDGWHMGTRYVELQSYKQQVNTINKIIQNRLGAGNDAGKFADQRKKIMKKIYENPYSKITAPDQTEDNISLAGSDNV